MNALFDEQIIEKSMKAYFDYNIAKYKEIYQIALMLLGYKKEDINMERKNKVNWRKVRTPDFVDKFME
jgi:HSP20 family molecular chaperone IbpA